MFVPVLLLLAPLAYLFSRRKGTDINGKHVLITGGSSGIGKWVAIHAVRRGANVTLVARNKTILDEAKADIQLQCKNQDTQKVQCVSVDISGSYEEVERAILGAQDALGPISVLINCAGTSISGKFEDTPMEEFQRMMNVNYIGTVNVIKVVLPGMKSRREGHIAITSSQAGLLGVFGYTAYSASKFALRGFAEALTMEVKPFKISITVSFPPDTNTPGFVEEEKTKPTETRQISQASTLLEPDQVGKDLLNDTLRGTYSSTTGFDGFIIATLCAGMSPISSGFSLIMQASLMGLLRIISAFYLCKFDKIIQRCIHNREINKRLE